MNQKLLVTVAIAMVLCLSIAPAVAKKSKKKAEPDHVVVQHFLIGFDKSVKSKKVERSKKEARALAEKLYQRALDGADFDALVKEYTDDKYPGIMSLTNKGAPMRGDSRTRDEVVYGFGDMAFSLAVGEIGFVPYGYSASPFGWHVIKRLE
jgi:hypothetical protein